MVSSSGAVAEVPIGAGALILLGFLLGVFAMRGRTARANLLVLLLAIFLVPTVAITATGMLPYTFTNGTVADAEEVNANFDYLDGRLSGLSGEFPVWVDSTGKVIGRTDITGLGAVRRINDEWFRIPIPSTTGFGSSGGFAFTSDDCTGPRYLLYADDPIRPIFIDDNGVTSTVARETLTIEVRSTSYGFCESTSGSSPANEVIPAPIDLATEFTPPFQLR